MEMRRSGGSIIGLVVVALIIESLQYYEKIEGDVAKMCLTLLEYTHCIQNYGKPFLLSDAFFLADDKKQ